MFFFFKVAPGEKKKKLSRIKRAKKNGQENGHKIVNSKRPSDSGEIY
jgi:hypothetical protein